jgi:tetratricopeptide (TPR) repeat protein
MRLTAFTVVAFAHVLFAQQEPARARSSYDEGRMAMRERRTDDAVRAFERAVALDSTKSEYHVWLGHAYTRQLMAASFIRKGIIGRRIGPQYDRAVALDSGSIEAAEARLDFYLNAPGIAGGGMDKAQAEAVRIEHLSAYYGAFARATIAQKSKNWVTAETEYRSLIRAYPDSTRPVNALASLLQTQERFAEAFDVIDRRLARVPDDTFVVYQLGRTAALSGQNLSRGAAALERFLALLGVNDPASRAPAHYRLGMIREKQGDVQAARAQYDSAVALSPRYDDAIAARKRLRP